MAPTYYKSLFLLLQIVCSVHGRPLHTGYRSEGPPCDSTSSMAVVTGGSSSVPPAQSAQAAPSDAPVQSNASTQSVASPHGVASTRSVVSSQSSSLAQSVPAATIGSTTVSITTSYSSEIPPTQTASATVKPNTSGVSLPHCRLALNYSARTPERILTSTFRPLSHRWIQPAAPHPPLSIRV